MSRETNSILLRYGINTFWSSSISTSRSLYSNLQLNSFFDLFLINFFFRPLKIQYSINLIIVYLFYFKNDKLSFLKKYFLWKKIKINSLLCKKKYNTIISFNKTEAIDKSRHLITKLFFLLQKIILTKLFFIIIKNKTSVFLIYNKNIVKKRFNILLYKKTKIRLKTINIYLKLKRLSLLSSIILSSYLNKSFKIVLRPALKKLLDSKMPFFFKFLKLDNQKKKIYILLTGLLFNKSNILNLYISTIIKNTKNKKHIKNLIVFLNMIKILFNKQVAPFIGYKFFISGRLNGKLRKGSFGFKLGTLKLMSLDTHVNYSCDIVHTQYGCFSLKSWLFENHNIKNE